jgi:release factor glutamine methyltransferase
LTVAEAVEHAGRRLEAAGIAAASDDAERLLRHVLGWDRARVLAEARAPLAPAQLAEFGALVGERARRRPLQHLTGRQAFWRHEFLVSPEVLIPRPETEALVEEALSRMPAGSAAVVVDVGTGSGCIALSLAADRPGAEVHAVDLSRAALEVARENERRLGLEGRVRWQEGDLLETARGPFDLVVSNPPYVDPRTRAALEPEVRDYEPALALFPPGEPYAVYRRLVPQASALLRPGGALLLEVGLGMADAVEDLARGAGLAVEPTRPDLQGIPRVVVATRLFT